MADYGSMAKWLLGNWDAPARAYNAQAPSMPSDNSYLGNLFSKIHGAIDPVNSMGGYGGLIGMALPPGRAWHGSPTAIQGAFRPSDYGRFGPGVYASEVEGVAKRYGTPQSVAINKNIDLFDASPRMLGEAENSALRSNVFGKLTPQEQKTVSEWWAPGKYLTGEDAWEILSRRLGKARAQSVIKDMGHGGITGIGDGQEIVVFDPANISPSGQ